MAQAVIAAEVGVIATKRYQLTHKKNTRACSGVFFVQANDACAYFVHTGGFEEYNLQYGYENAHDLYCGNGNRGVYCRLCVRV